MTTRVVIEGLEERNLLAGVAVTLADMRSNLKLSLARLASGRRSSKHPRRAPTASARSARFYLPGFARASRGMRSPRFEQAMTTSSRRARCGLPASPTATQNVATRR